MREHTPIPCKRPKVTIDPNPRQPDSSVTVCHVPGCGWTYPNDPQRSTAVKVDATEQATRHRKDHRTAVPAVTVIRSHGADPYHVECMGCGFLRCDGTTTTRTDAEGVRDRHLVNDHGLVTC